MEFKIYVHKPIWLMKYTKKSIRFFMFQLNASFRGVECEMLDMYFDCTDNTAYCSLRELDSKVIISSPKFVGSSQYFFSITWFQLNASFRGVECEMLDMYFDCTDNTAYCSLRELDSKVLISSPKLFICFKFFFTAFF